MLEYSAATRHLRHDDTEGTAEPAEIAKKKIFLCVLCVLCGFFFVVVHAQDEPPAAPRTSRLAVLQAEDRRAPTPRDLAIIRSGLHGGDAQTVRVAVRALGRLERPALIADLAPLAAPCAPGDPIRSRERDRAGGAGMEEGQSKVRVQGSRRRRAAIDAASTPLAARLKIEAEPDVREALCDALGRLPYVNAAQVEAAERTLVDMAGRAETVTDRLGVAQGLEALVRIAAQAARARRGRGRACCGAWRFPSRVKR